MNYYKNLFTIFFFLASYAGEGKKNEKRLGLNFFKSTLNKHFSFLSKFPKELSSRSSAFSLQIKSDIEKVFNNLKNPFDFNDLVGVSDYTVIEFPLYSLEGSHSEKKVKALMDPRVMTAINKCYTRGKKSVISFQQPIVMPAYGQVHGGKVFIWCKKDGSGPGGNDRLEVSSKKQLPLLYSKNNFKLSF